MGSTLGELTAAGLFGTFTRFPFHPTPCNTATEQNLGKSTIKVLMLQEEVTYFDCKVVDTYQGRVGIGC